MCRDPKESGSYLFICFSGWTYGGVERCKADNLLRCRKINHWLKSQHLEELSYVRSAGFYLSENSRPQINKKLLQYNMQYHYEFSKKERIAWSAIFILTRETSIFLQDLLDKLIVSRSTLLNDIKELKEQLSHFQVKLQFQKFLWVLHIGRRAG